MYSEYGSALKVPDQLQLMKPFIALFFLLCYLSQIFAQAPFNQDPDNPNLDFSTGTFDHWQLSHGDRGLPYTQNGPLNSANSHTIIGIYGNNWDGNTGIGNLRRVPEGLSHVARLGAPAGGGYGAPKSYALQYEIQVHAAFPILFFRLAAIMDKSHTGADNTHYKFSIRNAAGALLPTPPCTVLSLTPRGNVVGGSNIVTDPLIPYPAIPELGAIAYQPWESVAMDLNAYAGQTVRISFEHNDCYTGHHGSYSYISAGMQRAVDTIYFCRGIAQTTIKPYLPGFQTYQWSNGSVTDSLVVSNPVDNAVYRCTVSSYNGCSNTFTYILKENSLEAAFTTAGASRCNEIQFYDQSQSSGNAVISWQWTFGDPESGAANYETVVNPKHQYPRAGDYTVTLTVSDSRGCTHTITKTINVSPEGTIARLGLPDTLCKGQQLRFKDETQHSSGRSWLMDGHLLADTSRELLYTFPLPGAYKLSLIATGYNGCPDTVQQDIQVHDLPVAAITVIPNTLAAPVSAPQFRFKGLEEQAQRYTWNFGYNGYTAEGQYSRFTYPATIAQYPVLLTVYNKQGCSDTASVLLSIQADPIGLPNAFSPNGDGKNEVFKALNITNQVLLEFSVYNRYGQRVFFTLQPGIGWDGAFAGRPCESDTYYYILRYRLPDSDTEYVLKGDVVLVR